MFTVLGVSVGVAHPVGELEGMPLLMVMTMVSVMEGEQVTEDQVLDEGVSIY